MSENINSIIIIIPLEGVEKIKSSKTMTATMRKDIVVGILQVSFAAGFLKVPIQQHCTLQGAVFYNTLENPPRCFQKEANQYYNKPFHII